MKHQDAVALIRAAVGDCNGGWADLGCGTGTFTRALVDICGPNTHILAVDQDAAALDELARWAERHAAGIRTLRADFAGPSTELRDASFDGILLANSLHFVRDAEAVLARLTRALRAPSRVARGGRVVLVEYDRRDANEWVPYPVPRDRLTTLGEGAGLSPFVVTATRPSRY